MDQSTHDVRRTQWIEIISACQARPEGTTVKQWLLDNGIKDKAYCKLSTMSTIKKKEPPFYRRFPYI